MFFFFSLDLFFFGLCVFLFSPLFRFFFSSRLSSVFFGPVFIVFVNVCLFAVIFLSRWRHASFHHPAFVNPALFFWLRTIAIVSICWGLDECVLAEEGQLKHLLLAFPGVIGGRGWCLEAPRDLEAVRVWGAPAALWVAEAFKAEQQETQSSHSWWKWSMLKIGIGQASLFQIWLRAHCCTFTRVMSRWCAIQALVLVVRSHTGLNNIFWTFHANTVHQILINVFLWRAPTLCPVVQFHAFLQGEKKNIPRRIKMGECDQRSPTVHPDARPPSNLHQWRIILFGACETLEQWRATSKSFVTEDPTVANFNLGIVAWPSCRALESHFQLLSAVSKMEDRSGLESTKL